MWWSLMITVAIGRYILRTTRKGLRFDAADWLTLLALLMLTLTLSLLNISRYGFDNLPGFSRNISPASLDLDPGSTRLWKTYGILASVRGPPYLSGNIITITTSCKLTSTETIWSGWQGK
ncbi:hypothetical protein EYR41_008678 [Orbilia oligospora]|uniref:Uncharacterized protein n=1 Tax=Orbilia oligospora TaxID=2813651 RepID=A0A8H2DTR4_ORBOL|nr:hypothetical protein EYR41_008678 [Orbilia oligospora]